MKNIQFDIDDNKSNCEFADSCPAEGSGAEEVKGIAERFGVSDINLIKPGIGEATRVLLRRVPWKILIDSRYMNDSSTVHIRKLAKEKGVNIEEYPMKHYKACGIIKKMSDV